MDQLLNVITDLGSLIERHGNPIATVGSAASGGLALLFGLLQYRVGRKQLRLAEQQKSSPLPPQGHPRQLIYTPTPDEIDWYSRAHRSIPDRYQAHYSLGNTEFEGRPEYMYSYGSVRKLPRSRRPRLLLFLLGLSGGLAIAFTSAWPPDAIVAAGILLIALWCMRLAGTAALRLAMLSAGLAVAAWIL